MAAPPIDILFEEGACLIVCKPSGLLTQAPPGIDSMEVRTQCFLKDRDHKTGNVYLGLPHRLDRPVSGALVLAKNSRAIKRLGQQFAARLVQKTYWACVAGRVEPAEGTWEDYLRKIPDEPRAEIASASHPDRRLAVLHYRTLGHDRTTTWLKIELETGRMHQIRVQAASRGHAILGDAQYGSDLAFGPPHDDVRLRAIALHARRVSLAHPMTHAPISVVAPLGAAWQELPQTKGITAEDAENRRGKEEKEEETTEDTSQ